MRARARASKIVHGLGPFCLERFRLDSRISVFPTKHDGEDSRSLSAMRFPIPRPFRKRHKLLTIVQMKPRGYLALPRTIVKATPMCTRILLPVASLLTETRREQARPRARARQTGFIILYVKGGGGGKSVGVSVRFYTRKSYTYVKSIVPVSSGVNLEALIKIQLLYGNDHFRRAERSRRGGKRNYRSGANYARRPPRSPAPKRNNNYTRRDPSLASPTGGRGGEG